MWLPFMPLLASWQQSLLLTGDVRGSVFGVDKYQNAQCVWGADVCECYGGAARRVAALSAARAGTDTVALDHGEHFYGTGLFYAAFRGRASAEFFRASNYSGFTLRYRDLVAFISSTDKSGMHSLAEYLDQLAPIRPVVTNLDVTDTPLSGRVASHALIAISNGRKLGLLGIADGADMHTVNPPLHARLSNHLTALKAGVATLLALSTPPDLVVAVLPAHGVSRDARRLDPTLVTNSSAIVSQVAREVRVRPPLAPI